MLWGHVAGVDVCGRESAYSIDGDMWQGVGACGRVWGHVAGCATCPHTLLHAPTPYHMSPSRHISPSMT